MSMYTVSTSKQSNVSKFLEIFIKTVICNELNISVSTLLCVSFKKDLVTTVIRIKNLKDSSEKFRDKS